VLNLQVLIYVRTVRRILRDTDVQTTNRKPIQQQFVKFQDDKIYSQKMVAINHTMARYM
jgi:Trm5-related predicted tRNA methylase